MLDTDSKYCQSIYSDKSKFIQTSYDPDRALTFGVGKDSDIIKYMLNFDVISYIQRNLVSLIPWLLLVGISVMSCICCTGYYSASLCMNNKKILSPTNKKKAIQEKKKLGKKSPAKEEHKEGEEDEEEEDEDDEEEEELEPKQKVEKYKPANNPEFKQREFKIILGAQIFFILGLIGVAAYNHTQLDTFTNQYLQLSCKFTELANVFLNGNSSAQNFDFVGLNQMLTNAKTIKTQFEANLLSASDFTTLSTDMNTLRTNLETLGNNLGVISYGKDYSQYTKVKDPSSSTQEVYLDYLSVGYI